LLAAVTRIVRVASQDREANTEEQIKELDLWLSELPPPDGKNKMYAADFTELWVIKGGLHNRLKQPDKARAAFEKVVEIGPWSDSQNVQYARRWLETHRLGERVKP
jgi:hypothetical protein